MTGTVDVYCIRIYERTINKYGFEEIRSGFFAIEENEFSMCDDPTEDVVIKTFSKSKICYWVGECKEFIKKSKASSQYNDLQHNIKFTIKKLKIPSKKIQKQLRKDGYI